MKIGKKIGTWWRKKSTRYAAAGAFLLALAGVALALGAGSGARAAETLEELKNNGEKISTAEEFERLRSGVASGNYTLENDITIDNINSAATGTFSGILDGGGHVITIKNIEISDSTSGAASHGILFGEVTGTVENLIVNIADGDASYTRTSSAGTETDSPQTETTPTGDPLAPSYGEDTTLSTATSTGEELSFAQKLQDSPSYYVSGGSMTENDPGNGSAEYKREEKEQEVKETTTYDLSSPGTDAFGVLCGTLGLSASISRVEVKGETLTVTQKASQVDAQKTKNGTRDQYFYYKVERGQTEEVTAGGASASASGTINVYAPGEVTADSGSQSDNLYVNVLAPKYVKAGSELEYKVTVKNNSKETISGIALTSSLNGGDWSNSSGGSNVSASDFDLSADAEEVFTYKISSVSGGNIIRKFTAKTQGADGTSLTAATNNLTTTAISPGQGILQQGTNGNLKITLSTDKTNYFVGDPVNCTLTIENTWEKSDASGAQTGQRIEISNLPSGSVTGTGITNGTIDWNSTGGEITIEEDSDVQKITDTYTLDSLTAGDQPLELTISTGTVTGTCTDIFENVTQYTYVPYEKMGITEGTPETGWKYGSISYNGSEQSVKKPSANNLYAGVIAGISSGSVTEAKQDLAMSGTAEVSDNGALLAVGGIAGQINGSPTLSDLYIQKTGRASVSGSEAGTVSVSSGPVAGQVADGASVTLSDSLVLEGALGSGISSQNVYYTISNGMSLASDKEDSKWKSFAYFTADGTETVLDLSWLVSETEYETTFDNGTLTVNFPDEAVPARTPMQYCFAYEARKDMDGTEDYQRYAETESMKIDLGGSAYYRLLSLYVSDGFYHYIQEIGEPQTVFPYDGDASQSPYNEITGDVVRQTDGSDKIELTFTEVPSSGNNQVYYRADGDIPTGSDPFVSIADSKALLPFEAESVRYRITPVIGGHIYPTAELEEFTAEDREPLPQPELSISTAYQEDGSPAAYEALVEGTKYQSGNRVKAEIDGMEDCTLKYLFSVQEPEAGSWTEGRYTGSGDIDTLMSGSTPYSEYMELPEVTGETGYYLYIQVSKEYCSDELYCYGLITVVPHAQAAARVVIPETGEALNEGEAVVAGDVLELEYDGDTTHTLQYAIQYSQGSTHTWTDYDAASRPVFSSGTGTEIYVYTRVKLSGNSYSETTLHTFSAGGNCAEVRITPNTIWSAGSEPDAAGASEVDSGEVASLTSQTPGADIIYWTSESYAPFQVERAQTVPEGIADGNSDGEYAYFQVGERWYRATSSEVSRYIPADGVVIRNEKETAQTVYVYAASLAEGMEPGPVRTYRYTVNPQQQVAVPEAALPTRYLPDGGSLEQTEVEMGASLSFSSATAGAELYYSIGSGAEPPAELYDTSKGVTVTGTYGRPFVVRMMAKREGMLDSEIRTFVYKIAEQDPADAPTSVPATSAASPATVTPGDKILLSTVTRGADIYYTTDGTSPQLEELPDGSFQIAEGSSAQKYDPTQGVEMPQGSGFFTIRAVAARTGLALSSEVHLTFAYPDDVLSPYASVSSGSVPASTSVALRNRTEDAVIYYTVAYGGQVPADPTISSAVFDESQLFVITRETRIKAIAVKDGVVSETAEFHYTLMDALDAPTASIESGSMVARGTVLQLEAASGATIYYTMDGSDPSDLANTAVVQGDSLTLNGEAGGQVTVMAMARQEGKSDSEVVTFTYQFSASSGGVTADVPTGSQVSNGSKVNLMTDVTGAAIYYTTDGSSPATGGTAGSTVTVQGTPGSTFTIKAVARVDGVSGTVVSFMYRIKEVPNAPTASPSGGTLTVAARVTLSSNSGQIYYTTDGTTPTESSSLYTEPILINRTTNLRAISVSEDGEVSEVASFQYTAASEADAPEASRADGELLEPGSVVSLYTDTSGAVIYYSTDGTEPTPDNLENLLQYTEEGITVNRTVTIKAAAYREDLQLSDVSEFHYEVETIPAVEMKRAEAERLAEEGLHDTDASGLARRESGESDTDMRQLEETEHYTVASFAREAAADNVRLVTTRKNCTSTELDNVKQLYGEDYTILSSYDIRLMVGSTQVRPDGDTEIGIPIPDAYENAAVVIASVDENSRFSPLETRRENGMVYAYMNSQSHYVLIGLEHPDGAGFRLNYLLFLEIAAGLTAAAGAVYFISRRWKKDKESG